MFTVKLYSADGFRQIIREAESFTILRGPNDPHGSAEITLHQKNSSDDTRYDVCDENDKREIGSPPRFAKAIIENSAGRTTEIISLTSLSPKAKGGSRPQHKNKSQAFPPVFETPWEKVAE